MPKTKPFILRLNPELRARLEEHAAQRGLPLAGYIRMVLMEREGLAKK